MKTKAKTADFVPKSERKGVSLFDFTSRALEKSRALKKSRSAEKRGAPQ
jgi:hypothetical protein